MLKREDINRAGEALQISLGSVIKAFRGELGITQEELAWRARMHRTYVADIERGARNPTLRSIACLAAALEVSMMSLLSAATAPVDRPVPARAPEVVTPLPGEILMVEDDPNDAELALRAFKKARLTNPVRLARDGAEAIAYLFHRPAKVLPVLPQMILLDLNLPEVSGLEVLRRVKEDPRTRTIPVVILTVSERDGDIAACRKLGADSYIVKPVGFENFCKITPNLSFDWTLVKPLAGRPAQPTAA